MGHVFRRARHQEKDAYPVMLIDTIASGIILLTGIAFVGALALYELIRDRRKHAEV